MGNDKARLKYLMTLPASTFNQWEQGFIHGSYFGNVGHSRDVLGDLVEKAKEKGAKPVPV